VVLLDADVRRLERENILEALRQSGGRIRGPGGAAELLGLKPTTLASRIKNLKIRKPNA
jgi:transcriptional regulator with GAF, ATPase, and Fis domain